MEFKSISELQSLISDKKISVKEIADVYIKKIKEKKDLNIFIYFNEDKIYEQVANIEKKSNNNKLKGIPIAVKDLFCTKNMPTTAGSKILENFVMMKNIKKVIYHALLILTTLIYKF